MVGHEPQTNTIKIQVNNIDFQPLIYA